MQAPKCKICGLHHYGVCQIHKSKTGKIVSVSLPPQPFSKPLEATPAPQTTSGAQIIETPRQGYNAYMKEYMRKHRKRKLSTLTKAKDSKG